MGTLTINDGKTKREIKLRHGYAEYRGGIETVGDNPVWELIFSDRPLPEDRWDRELYVSVLSKEHKLNGLAIRFDANRELEQSLVYCDICTRTDGEEYLSNSEDEQVFESKALDGKTVTGTAYSSQLQDSWAANQKATFQYRVTFQIELVDDKPRLAKQLSQADDEPGRAYLSFYKAAQAGDLNAVRKLVAAEQRKAFDGSSANEALLRVKNLIKPFSRVADSQLLAGDRSAQLLVEEEIPGVVSGYIRPATTRTIQAIPPPPPPPPPGMTVPQVRKQSAGRAPGLTQVPPATPKIAKVAVARMILEEKQWKIYWLLEERFNVLSENYKTPEERAKAEEEALRMEKEEYFKVENGTALPTGGGAAGKAYLEFCRAEKMGDKKTLIKYLTGAQYDLYGNQGLTIGRGAYIWKESSSLDYANITVTGGTANQEEATLNVEAVRQGYRTTGKVKLILESGQWKIDREDWVTDDSTKAPTSRRGSL